jgi:2-polyprenyl-3-methyl-5-hydroxy-6-metoxy-1,4-benzoquinol methylase
MKEKDLTEKDYWKKVTDVLGNRQIELGQHWSYNLLNDPKRLAFVLSRYKFVAKMGAKDKKVLELGCSEGIGTPILSEFAQQYTGVDMDKDAIESARRNWTDSKVVFIEDDFLNKSYGGFDTVVSLDVIEHIMQDSEYLFWDTIYNNLGRDGIGIVGTPNITSTPYASQASRLGHVNMFTHERLKECMEKFFHNVFVLGMNDEIVHTGFMPMAHYLIAVGCNKKKIKGEAV